MVLSLLLHHQNAWRVSMLLQQAGAQPAVQLMAAAVRALLVPAMAEEGF